MYVSGFLGRPGLHSSVSSVIYRIQEMIYKNSARIKLIRKQTLLTFELAVGIMWRQGAKTTNDLAKMLIWPLSVLPMRVEQRDETKNCKCRTMKRLHCE